jgi:hypothetical protein
MAGVTVVSMVMVGVLWRVRGGFSGALLVGAGNPRLSAIAVEVLRTEFTLGLRFVPSED